MKKTIALILCLVMAFACLIPAGASYLQNTDLDHYKYMNVYKDGKDTYVKPDQPITRGELANVIFNLLNSNTKNVHIQNFTNFSDLSEDHEYFKQINFLVYRGFMNGYPDGTFRPDGVLTRAELAEVVVRTQKFVRNISTVKAPDIDGHWAMGAINTMVIRGFMKGYPDGTFGPDRILTRAEVAATMNRVYNRELDSSSILQNTRLINSITNQIVTPYDFKQIFPDLPEDHWAYDAMMEACVSHRIYWDDVGKREIWIQELYD